MRVPLSLRLTSIQDERLKAIGQAHGYARYQAAIRALEIGIASLMGNDKPAREEGMSEAMGEVLARIERLEALMSRTLYVSAMNFAYARRTALKGEGDPAKVEQGLSEAGGEAFRRQRDLARSGHHD